jgi:hypothetical protein
MKKKEVSKKENEGINIMLKNTFYSSLKKTLKYFAFSIKIIFI